MNERDDDDDDDAGLIEGAAERIGVNRDERLREVARRVLFARRATGRRLARVVFFNRIGSS